MVDINPKKNKIRAWKFTKKDVNFGPYSAKQTVAITSISEITILCLWTQLIIL